MNIQEVDAEFKAYIYDRHPELLDSIKLAVYKIGEKEQDEKRIDINSQTIQGLLVDFKKAYLISPNPKHYTAMYNLVRQLARRTGNEAKITRLEELYETMGYLNFPLPVVEKVVFRDTMSPTFSMNKTYNYGRHSKVVKLGDLVKALDDAEVLMFDIFDEICAEADIEIPRYDLSGISSTLPDL